MIFLIFAVILGVTAAERQINALAKQHNCVQSFSVWREVNRGQYAMYLFGDRYTLEGVFSIVQLVNHTHGVEVKMKGFSGSVPLYFGVDCTNGFRRLSEGTGDIKKAAWIFKAAVNHEGLLLMKNIRSYLAR
jgi:hypothetical protein